jgi:hypothetical protein
MGECREFLDMPSFQLFGIISHGVCRRPPNYYSTPKNIQYFGDVFMLCWPGSGGVIL